MHYAPQCLKLTCIICCCVVATANRLHSPLWWSGGDLLYCLLFSETDSPPISAHLSFFPLLFVLFSFTLSGHCSGIIFPPETTPGLFCKSSTEHEFYMGCTLPFVNTPTDHGRFSLPGEHRHTHTQTHTLIDRVVAKKHTTQRDLRSSLKQKYKDLQEYTVHFLDNIEFRGNVRNTNEIPRIKAILMTALCFIDQNSYFQLYFSKGQTQATISFFFSFTEGFSTFSQQQSHM